MEKIRLGKILAVGAAAFLTLTPISAAMAIDPPRQEDFTVADGPVMENFNLLEGVWLVESHSVQQRMADETVWLENHMETEYRVLLDGLVVINDTYGTFNAHPMHGIMVRAYDPDKDEWQFHWMSKAYPHLTEQVRGRFEGGVGIFYGTEASGGITYNMRFRWKMITDDHAFWEQSYQNPKTQLWETNWTLDLRRKL